ncbi:spermidine/putrescine ABC transporter substrate-binding protein [Leucobacter sp. wl10]|nr:spermidine/putrescine ABC transporter substrate-binding protein [Leucobacter sp. wl10]RGE24402.1 spermidine/putrescine ABC transporter substrate-binding protein [Leucobacter sp. wl10]
MSGAIEQRVDAAVDAWLRWVPGWTPGTHRGRARLCRRCTGSPMLAAAGLTSDVPHQVTHALVSRMQRIIDRRVDEFTEQQLPMLHAELTGEQMWRAGGYDPAAGLDPEYEGLDPDPDPADGEQPFLFTLAGLAEESRSEPLLPRPPLSADEKRQLRREVELADRCAEEAGRAVCFALMAHRSRIESAVRRFVEPQIRAMLDELSRNLEPPQ